METAYQLHTQMLHITKQRWFLPTKKTEKHRAPFVHSHKSLPNVGLRIVKDEGGAARGVLLQAVGKLPRNGTCDVDDADLNDILGLVSRFILTSAKNDARCLQTDHRSTPKHQDSPIVYDVLGCLEIVVLTLIN